MSLFDNKNYTVELNDNSDGYNVVNKETGVIEYTESSLPRCIIVAAESSSALDRYFPEEEAKDEPKGVVRNLFPIPQREADDASDSPTRR